MPQIITLNSDNIVGFPESSIPGTPMTGRDIHGFKIAAQFSKIPQDEWKRLLPEMNDCELVSFSSSFYQWGAKNLLGVSIDYTVIDHRNGEYRSSRESFAKDADSPVENFFSEMGRKDLVSGKDLYKVAYPFRHDTLEAYLGIFNRGFSEAAEKEDEMWTHRRDFFEKMALPCINALPIEERKEIIKNSGALNAPYHISWKLWAFDQILPRDELKTILSGHDLNDLEDHENRERSEHGIRM